MVRGVEPGSGGGAAGSKAGTQFGGVGGLFLLSGRLAGLFVFAPGLGQVGGQRDVEALGAAAQCGHGEGVGVETDEDPLHGQCQLRLQVGREPVGATMARVVRQPGTWLGFFTHWMGMFPTAVLVLMWGMSWMTQGLGLPTATASALLTANTAAGVVGSFVAGALSARLPARRAATITVTSLMALGAWCAGLALPGALPAAATATILLGFTAPFSGVGFDSARSFNEPARWGTCTGVVNMGGFTATILAVELVGLVLDASGGDRSAEDFRAAFAAMLVPWLTGMTGLVLARGAVGRRLRAGGPAARF